MCILLIVSMTGAMGLTRLLLYAAPEVGGSRVAGFHVHHMLLGILLIVIGGVPAVLMSSDFRERIVAVALFGAGTGLALDEWVLFVLREEVPETPYLHPVSGIGALAMIAAAVAYTLLVRRILTRRS